jgi:autotransporter-associated beta strand protein
MHINPKSKFPAISNPVDPMKLRSFHQLLPFTLLTVAFTLPLAAQTSVTLDGASGNQIFNVARSTTGGLTIGLGFEVEYLVVGGGGGGGNGYDDGPGGGGGAGGLLQGNLTFQTATSIGVAVGTGGLANSGNGGNSSFGSTIALGGGGGGGSRESGLNGGSGGGAGGRPVGGSRIGGTASIGQGNSGGGNSGNVSGFGIGGGGGGGAGSAGASSSTRTGAAGGAGLSLDISGTNVSYAVGGSGGSGGTGAAVNASIIGGGGRGAFGGNNGGSTQSGGQGANGIVIARYKGTSAGTGGTVTAGTGTAAGYTLHTFTSTGTSALDFSGLNLNSRLGAIENGVISGSGGLTFSGPGTLTLGGANTFTGDTRVGLGTLSLNHSNALAGSTLNMASSDDGTVAFGLAGNNTYNIGGITGSKNLEIGGNVLSVGANNANSTYSGQISGIGSLTKSGTSTLMMSGASSYTGATVVSDGLLVVNGSISTSILTTIQSGATLGGSGAVGALTVQAGGTVAPGNSPGILSTGNYNQAGTLSLELNGTLAGAEYDQVNVIGTVNLSGLLTATVGYTPVNDQLLFILNNDGSDAITGTFSGLADLDTIDLAGYQWRISYTANYAGSNTGTFTGGNDIALMAIPEPSALVFLGLSTFCIVSRRRRKA